jgi:putative membrane protein
MPCLLLSVEVLFRHQPLFSTETVPMSFLFHSALPTLLVLGLSSPTAAPKPAAPHPIDDTTALAMFEALITYDIETAGIAVKKAVNPAVRELANSFEQGHRGLLKNTQDLAKKLNMTATPPKVAPLGQAHSDALRKLNATTGEEFKRVFLANEIAYHEGAIKILRDTLAPAIKNPELKAAVMGAVPAFEAHLAASQKVAATYQAIR